MYKSIHTANPIQNVCPHVLTAHAALCFVLWDNKKMAMSVRPWQKCPDIQQDIWVGHLDVDVDIFRCPWSLDIWVLPGPHRWLVGGTVLPLPHHRCAARVQSILRTWEGGCSLGAAARSVACLFTHSEPGRLAERRASIISISWRAKEFTSAKRT